MEALEDPRIARRLQGSEKYRRGERREDGCTNPCRSIRPYEDLAAELESTDANRVIAAMREINPSITGLLSPRQIGDLRKRLVCYLGDTRMKEFAYGGFQADEDDTSTVSEAANYALKRLEGIE